jgi:TRAP-type C4-dicarboxylate transport system permease small subunit
MNKHGQLETGDPVSASGLARLADSINSFIEPVYRWLGYVGAAVLGFLVLAMVYSIVARRAFNAPLEGSGDIITLSLLVFISLTLGIEHMGHEKMTVDVLARRLPERAQLIIAPIIYALCMVILAVAVWQLIRYGITMHGRGEHTRGTLKLPKAPFAFLITFGIFTLIPIYLSRFLAAVSAAVKR